MNTTVIYPIGLYSKLMNRARALNFKPIAWHMWEGRRPSALKEVMSVPVRFSQETEKAVVLETDRGCLREYINDSQEDL